ncbi:MAG TPA: PQQ-binding-like beta-propeller repeat protein [Micromonospora sp.]|nr:PQQ-binding-like beta-propeller repeat protein [Micromonospora sp.]
MGSGGWRRRGVIVASVGVVLAGVAVVNHVLAPTEVLSTPRTPYGTADTRVVTGVLGTLTAAPLIVDNRLRVYATTRQLWADQPVGAASVRTPYWSYRRWPAELTGVVADGTTVVSRWSDRKLVALEVDTGRIAWRATGPDRRDDGYAGRRTGAATVYAPPGLYIGQARNGGRVLVVAGGSELRGLDLATGRTLWGVELGGSCRRSGFTATSGYFVTVDACRSPQAVAFHDLATGAVVARWRPAGAGRMVDLAPVGCVIGRSACPAMRTTSAGKSRGWLLDGVQPAVAPALDRSDAWLVGDVVVAAPGLGGGPVTAWSVRTGGELWRRVIPDVERVLAVQPGRIHLLTRSRGLVTVAPSSGAELSRFPLTYQRDSMDWVAGFAYAGNGFVAVERLRRPVDPDADDPRYYVDIQPVIFAGT